jgi:uncharacterized membrane protein YbhN (UPF0104 family)
LRAFDVSTWTLVWPLLFASCVVLLGGYFLTGWLWGRIVVDLGGPDLPTGVRIRLFMIANLGRYVPGKVWQIAGLAALGRRHGVPGPTGAAAAVVGQGVALAAAALIGMGSVWTLTGDQPGRWAVPVALVVAVAVGLTPPVFRFVTDLWFRLAKTPKPARLDARHGALWLLVALANWTMFAVAFWLLVVGLGIEAPFLATASAFAAAYVLGYLMLFAPAGIGVREGFLVAFLSPHMGAAAAGAVALVARLWTTLVEVIPAAAFWTRHLATAPDTTPEGTNRP